MRYKKALFLLVIVLVINACRNYYFDVIEWSTNIPVGMSLDSVKISQPNFVSVDWAHPDTLTTETRIYITAVKNKPKLQAVNYLRFVNNKYQGRFTK